MDTVRREVVLPVEADEAWDRVTEDGWLECLEPWVGGTVADDGQIGEVEEVVPGRRLSWAWRDDDGNESAVDLTLFPEADRTRVVVVELPRPLAVAAGEPRALCVA